MLVNVIMTVDEESVDISLSNLWTSAVQLFCVQANFMMFFPLLVGSLCWAHIGLEYNAGLGGNFVAVL